MPRRNVAKSKFLIARVGAREHVLAHWYAAIVVERPVADLLRETSVTELLTRASAALACRAFPVPGEFSMLNQCQVLQQSA